MDTPPPVPSQPLPRDKTRIVKPKMHPAAKAAAQSWAKLHGHKFAANAGRLGKK